MGFIVTGIRSFMMDFTNFEKKAAAGKLIAGIYPIFLACFALYTFGYSLGDAQAQVVALLPEGPVEIGEQLAPPAGPPPAPEPTPTPAPRRNPNPEPTPEQQPAPEPTPRATPRPRPTPRPVIPVLPAEPQCSVYQVEVRDWSADEQGKKIFSGAGSQLSCLQQILSACGSNGHAYRRSNRVSTALADSDDCVADGFFLDQDVWKNKFSEDFGGYRVTHRAPLGSRDRLRKVSSVTRGMDAHCRPVDITSVADVCGTLTVNYINTPISLIWKNGASVSDHLSYVDFQLDPTASGKWFSWRASAQTPLLVYDPEQSGRITSAYQLFGNWTFGGRKVASLGEITHVPAAPPWKNGYEALGMLDSNQDGEVSGEELEPLALWFDANQNGVSEAGEVRPLSEARVTKLFYQPDYVDEKTKDIHLNVGFERIVDGKLESGRSVDWYTEESASPFEALMKNQFRSVIDEEISSEEPRAAAATELSEDKEKTAAASLASPLQGAWWWQIEGKPFPGIDEQPKGLLTFKTSGSILTGHSYVEMPIRSGTSELKSIVIVSGLEGSIEKNAAGEIEGYFRATSPDGLVTKTSFVLAADGKSLKGRSETQVKTRGTDGKIASFTYDWTARQ